MKTWKVFIEDVFVGVIHAHTYTLAKEDAVRYYGENIKVVEHIE